MTEATSPPASPLRAPIFASKYDTVADENGNGTIDSSVATTSSDETNGSTDISNASTYASHTTGGSVEEEEYALFNRFVDTLCTCVDDVGEMTNVCRTENDVRAKPSLLYRSNQGRHSTKLQKRNNNNSFLKHFTSSRGIRMPGDAPSIVTNKGGQEDDKDLRGVDSKGSTLHRIRNIVSRKAPKKKKKKKKSQNGTSDEGSSKRSSGKKKHRSRKRPETAPHRKENLEVVVESPKTDGDRKSRRTSKASTTDESQSYANDQTPRASASTKTPFESHANNDSTPRASAATKTPLSPMFGGSDESAPPVSPKAVEVVPSKASTASPTAMTPVPEKLIDELAQVASGTKARPPSPIKPVKTLLALATSSAARKEDGWKSRKSGRSPTAAMFQKKSPRASARSKSTSTKASLSSMAISSGAHQPVSPPPSSPRKSTFWNKAPQQVVSDSSSSSKRKGRSRSPVKSPRKSRSPMKSLRSKAPPPIIVDGFLYRV